MRAGVVLLTLFMCFQVGAQINFLGKPGHLTIPSAEWETKKHFGVTFSYVPKEYTNGMFFSNAAVEKNTLNFYNLRVGLTSFMDVNLSIAHRPLLSDKIGIGDRQLDFRFRLLKETRYRPSFVLGITPPGSVSPVLSHDYLVATKNLNTSIGTFRITGGDGSPYLIMRRKSDDRKFLEQFKMEEKVEFRSGNKYLIGFFGGITYLPVDFGGVILEYNSTTMNAGAFVKLGNWLYLQGYTYEGKKAAFTLAAKFILDFKPYTLRKHEKILE